MNPGNCVFSHVAYRVSKTTLLSEQAVDYVFFSDEKVFTVASPVNLQNAYVYAPTNANKRDITPERLLRCRTTFSSSLMVSVAVSKLGCTELFFVEPGVKVDGIMLPRGFVEEADMLPVMRPIAGDTYVFQQDSAPAHHARDTVQLLPQAPPRYIFRDLWPPNEPDPNPGEYRIWSWMQERV